MTYAGLIEDTRTLDILSNTIPVVTKPLQLLGTEGRIIQVEGTNADVYRDDHG